MEANNLHSLSPDEDITIINFRSKLLIHENTYINKKLMNTYVCTYHGSGVRAIHRSMSDTVSLPEALSSVGFRCIGLPWDVSSSAKLQSDRADKDRPRIQVVDYLYKHPTLNHTNLVDASPIVMSGV